jgi:hypothetical protein
MSNNIPVVSKSISRIIKADITDRDGTVVAEQTIHDFMTRGYSLQSCEPQLLLFPHPNDLSRMEQRIILVMVFIDYEYILNNRKLNKGSDQ